MYSEAAFAPGPAPREYAAPPVCSSALVVGSTRPVTSDASAGGDGSLSVHARLGRHAFGACVRWPTSGAPLGSQSLSGVAAKRPAGWSPEAGREAVSGRADGAGTGAGAAARRTRKDRRNAPGVGVGGDTALRAPLVRLLLHVVEQAPRLLPLDPLLALSALQLEPAQLVFLVCTQFILPTLPGLELGGAPGVELVGGASCGERSLALLIVKLELRGGGGLSAAPLHQSPVAGFRINRDLTQKNQNPGSIFLSRSPQWVFFLQSVLLFCCFLCRLCFCRVCCVRVTC